MRKKKMVGVPIRFIDNIIRLLRQDGAQNVRKERENGKWVIYYEVPADDDDN